MAHEASQPETSHTPETRLFNVDAMSDDQIVVLNRGMWAVADEIIGDKLFTQEVDFFVHERVGDEVRGLAASDPARVKRLVERLTLSDVGVDHKLAAQVVPELIDFDYAFTRDTLISIYIGNTYEQMRVKHDPHDASETADDQISYLMRDHLTPDQIADFQRHAAFYDPDMPLEPARPDR